MLFGPRPLGGVARPGSGGGLASHVPRPQFDPAAPDAALPPPRVGRRLGGKAPAAPAVPSPEARTAPPPTPARALSGHPAVAALQRRAAAALASLAPVAAARRVRTPPPSDAGPTAALPPLPRSPAERGPAATVGKTPPPPAPAPSSVAPPPPAAPVPATPVSMTAAAPGAPLCEYFLAGYCRDGARCRHSHAVDDDVAAVLAALHADMASDERRRRRDEDRRRREADRARRERMVPMGVLLDDGGDDDGGGDGDDDPYMAEYRRQQRAEALLAQRAALEAEAAEMAAVAAAVERSRRDAPAAAARRHRSRSGGPGRGGGGGRRLGGRDDGVDVDRMTYEELLALEERMGVAEAGKMTAAELARLARAKYFALVEDDDADADGGKATCAICLDTFDDGAALVALPCGHRFHDDCGTRWLREAPVPRCPVCKADPRRGLPPAPAGKAATKKKKPASQ